jgi:hypothetical protein
MANREARRQKQLAHKRQKRKAKTHKTALGEAWSMARQLTLAANAPIHECWVPADLFETGIGSLAFSRSLADGRIALGMFLLDVFCLGVKNAFFAIVEPDEYVRRLSAMPGAEGFERMHPACFRKLVEGAVAYARDLGFKPHADYAAARRIFGEVEATACPEQFAYGHAGKPFYVSGPNETPAQARAIVEQLQRRLGPGKFEYVALTE